MGHGNGTGRGRAGQEQIDGDAQWLSLRKTACLSLTRTGILELGMCVCESMWPSWAPVPNKPSVSVDVTQPIRT